MAAIAIVAILRKLKASDIDLRSLLLPAKSKPKTNYRDRNGTQNDFLAFVRKLLKAVGKEKRDKRVVLFGKMCYTVCIFTKEVTRWKPSAPMHWSPDSWAWI